MLKLSAAQLGRRSASAQGALGSLAARKLRLVRLDRLRSGELRRRLATLRREEHRLARRFDVLIVERTQFAFLLSVAMVVVPFAVAVVILAPRLVASESPANSFQLAVGKAAKTLAAGHPSQSGIVVRFVQMNHARLEEVFEEPGEVLVAARDILQTSHFFSLTKIHCVLVRKARLSSYILLESCFRSCWRANEESARTGARRLPPSALFYRTVPT